MDRAWPCSPGLRNSTVQTAPVPRQVSGGGEAQALGATVIMGLGGGRV